MSSVHAVAKDAAIGVAFADKPENLTAFRKPGCAAAIWRRQPAPGLQNWLDALAPDRLPQGRVVLKPEGVRATVTQLCDDARTPSGVHREKLIDDIAALASLFAELMQTRYLRLRLAAEATNACRKFHIDAITGRLVCTYRGLGTQYGTSTNGEDPSRVFTVPTGSPILLRGTLWPEQPPSGLLHRSPPIEGTGEIRLVLVLDALDEFEEDL